MMNSNRNSFYDTLTEEQRKAVFSDARIIGVDASAGSGKTRVLVARILRLLTEKQIDLHNIVAITFTEKASAEMKQRLRDAFREFAYRSDPKELTRWRWLEQQLESAYICTIHSFCSSILREYSLKLGFNPEFRIMDEHENFLRLDNFLKEQLLNAIETDKDAFELAVELSTEGLSKVISVLFENAFSIVHWIEETRHYDNPEAYSRLFVDHIKETYQQLLLSFKKSLSIRLWILQLQKFDKETLNPENPWEQRRIGLIKDLMGIQQANDTETILSIIRNILNQRTSSRRSEEENKAVIEQIKNIINKIKDKLKRIYIEEWDSPFNNKVLNLNYKIICLFEKLYNLWTQKKREEGWVSFDDLIYLTRTLLKQSPEVCREIGNRFKYICIDEFQDTDREQAYLINELLSASDTTSLFFVGDAKQSIYMFRGAEVKVFQKQQSKADEVISLTRNFRSSPEILNFINTFFSQTNLLFEVEEPYQPMVPHRAKYKQPRVEFLFLNSSDGESKHKEDEIVIEAETIAKRIYDIVENNGLKIIDDDTGQLRETRYGDFAILFRTTTYLYQYEKALKSIGIPYQVVSGRGFFEVEEVKDILTFIYVLLNPYHDISLLSFLRGPFCGLSDEQITRWRIHAPLHELILDNIPIPEPLVDDKAYEKTRNLYRKVSAKIHLSVYELIQFIIEETGYEAILLTQAFGQQKVGNIQKLLALTNAYQENLPLNLYNYHRLIHRLKSEILEGEADLNLEPQNAVVLTTIHKAKGLEFPIVVLPDLHSSHISRYTERIRLHRDIGITLSLDADFSGILEEGKNKKIPWQEIIEIQNNFDIEQENARLLYVALTRARDYLILSGNREAIVKQNMNSWLSYLAYSFSIHNHNISEESNHLFVIHKLKVTETPTKSKSNVKPQIETNDKYLPGICFTPEQVMYEPISVTTLLNWMYENEKYEGDIHHLIDMHTNYHAERGTLLHTLLYLWDFNYDREPSLEQILSRNIEFLYIDNIEDEISELVQKIRGHPAYPLLKMNKPIYRELPFLWNVGEYTLKGTVDAILADGTIVDYKTGNKASENAQRYQKQLQIYFFALSETDIKVNKNLSLIYIDQQKYDINTIDISIKESLISEMNHAIIKYIQKKNEEG